MKERKPMLGKHDRIVCAFAKSAVGAGWSNQPVWIVIRSGIGGSLREECLQPEHQSPAIATLYRVSEAAHLSMKSAVAAALKVKGKP